MTNNNAPSPPLNFNQFDIENNVKTWPNFSSHLSNSHFICLFRTWDIVSRFPAQTDACVCIKLFRFYTACRNNSITFSTDKLSDSKIYCIQHNLSLFTPLFVYTDGDWERELESPFCTCWFDFDMFFRYSLATLEYYKILLYVVMSVCMGCMWGITSV